jgi:hypothetical protein
LLAILLPCSCGKDKPFDAYLLYNAAYWSWRESEFVDGEEIKVFIRYIFIDNGDYARHYQKYSIDRTLGYSRKVYEEKSETGTYRATETEIEFYPEGGVAYSVRWHYNQKNYTLTMKFLDGTSLEFSGLYYGNFYYFESGS